MGKVFNRKYASRAPVQENPISAVFFFLIFGFDLMNVQFRMWTTKS